VIAGLVIAAMLMAQAQPADASTDAESQVRAAESARIRATVTNDFEALDRLLADDLVYTHSNAQVDTKAQFIEILRSGRTKYQSIEPSDMTIRIYGPVAILTGQATVRVVASGEPRDLALRFTSAWHQRGGRWQFVAWQSTRVPQ
jgi:ketosteroid isomerase-like protein